VCDGHQSVVIPLAYPSDFANATPSVTFDGDKTSESDKMWIVKCYFKVSESVCGCLPLFFIQEIQDKLMMPIAIGQKHRADVSLLPMLPPISKDQEHQAT
jgi:hypothetical protein